MDDGTVMQMWSVVKNTIVILKQQQESIASLSAEHFKLVRALADQFGIERPQYPQAEPTTEELEVMNRGIRELEKMIGTDNETPEFQTGDQEPQP